MNICAHPCATDNADNRSNEYDDIENSNKIYLLFDILCHCQASSGKPLEKLVVFSQWLSTLEVIEHFLNKQYRNNGNHGLPWVKGKHYYRIDGDVTVKKRDDFILNFNNAAEKQARYFSIIQFHIVIEFLRFRKGEINISVEDQFNQLIWAENREMPSEREKKIFLFWFSNRIFVMNFTLILIF